LRGVTPAKQGEPEAAVSKHEAEDIIDFLCDPDRLVPARDRLAKIAQFGEAPGEPCSRAD
jgi:hypothetical protein